MSALPEVTQEVQSWELNPGPVAPLTCWPPVFLMWPLASPSTCPDFPAATSVGAVDLRQESPVYNFLTGKTGTYHIAPLFIF